MKKQGVSTDLGSSKGSVSKKLTQVQERIAKAVDLTTKTENKLKDIKDKDSENQDSSPFNYNAAEKFQQSVNTITDKKEAVSIKALKNFKRLRKTVLETANHQVYESEIDKIVSQSASPVNDEDEEYPDDNPEPPQKFAFSDSEFGPVEKDPSGLKSLGSNLSQKTRKLFWPKISDIADMGKAYFIENIGDPENPADSFWIKKIIQGQCDNLDFLNALIFVVSHTDLFNRIFNAAFERHFKHGIYSFKFFKNNNQSYYVLVDDRIPAIKKEDGEYVPFGARSEKNSEYWISLIEKAYAKLHLTYDNICSPNLKLADHFYSLTGLLLEEIAIDSNSLDLSLFWELLLNFRKYELPIACLRENNGNEGGTLSVEDGHIYIIIDVLQEDGRDIVKIADPWANSADLMEDQEVRGVSSLEFNVFLETFTKLLLVKDFPENWKGIKFDCEILSSKGGPSPQSSLWVENPQYVFDVTDKEEGNVIVRMHRYIGIQSLQAESLGSTFGFALFSLLSNELKIKTPDFKRLLTITKSTENENYVVANLKLAKGKYSLIPFTVEKGELAYFYCELFFDFRENLINFNFKSFEKILEPSFISIASLKPRILKNTLRLSDFEGTLLHGVRDNIMLLIPHSTSKIIYKEGVTPKFGLQKTAKQGSLSKTLGKTNATTTSAAKTGNFNKRLFDLKLDGQNEYELTAALLGLESGRGVNDEEDQINEEILASIEDTVDFSDYGLTDVGLGAVLDSIAQNKAIRVLNLAGNKLTDQIIFDLSEKLEVSHHFELEELDLSNNNIGKQGAETILEMIKTFKNLLKINITGNKDIPDVLKNKIDFALKKKETTR